MESVVSLAVEQARRDVKYASSVVTRIWAIPLMPLLLPILPKRPLLPLSVRLHAIALPVLLLFTGAAQAARGPEPPQRIPLEPFGYQPIASRYLLGGATMLTLDYVDNQHILVTFGVPKLMQRLADCPPDDEDRVVKAVLLELPSKELPSGRELGHTEWRFHDFGEYLWDLGGGHFLLRNRDALTTFSPLQNLASGHPFAERLFLKADRHIESIIVSANRDLLSINTIKYAPPKPQALQSSISQPGVPSSPAGSQSPTQPPTRNLGLQRRDTNTPKSEPTPNQVSFIRVLREVIPAQAPEESNKLASPPVRIVARLDGRIYTSAAVNVPVTMEGFLRSKATTRDGVLLDFLTFTGKDLDLGDFATSCPPRPTFVSPSEFVAFGCRGDAQSLDLAGFNLHGDFLWQINFTDEQAYPSFASSIPAGRFAFSRTVTSSHVFGNETPSMSQLQDQEVRVIQTYNGKQLLRAIASPIQRAGQNFALSPDGLMLAVIHDAPTVKAEITTHHTAIELYTLPPLSEKDRIQVKLEAAMAPGPANVHFRFSEEEIKAALAEKPEQEDVSATSPNPHATQSADAHVVGDAIHAPAAPSTGIVPSSDPPPECANLTEADATLATGCPVVPLAKASTAASHAAASSPEVDRSSSKADRPSSEADRSGPQAAPDAEPEKHRKPPTLYEPIPPDAQPSPPK